MSPRRIVEEAARRKLDIIAITDHNSAGNCRAVMEAARGSGLVVIPGIEAATREEIHLLGLFPNPEAAEAVQRLIFENLDGVNDPRVFGVQAAVEADGTIRFFEERLLIGASRLKLESMTDAIHRAGGLAVAAHIDRQAFGIIGQLGFIPPEPALDALELSAAAPLAVARQNYPEYAHYTFLNSSDAHYPEDIGRAPTNFLMENADFRELGFALRRLKGRGIIESSDAGPVAAHT